MEGTEWSIDPTTALVPDLVDPPPSAPPARRRLVLGIRIVGSLALLALLVWQMPDFDPSKLIPEWTSATPLWLGGSMLTLLVAFALQTLRWSQVLTALGHKVPFRRLFNQFLAGQFVSNVLPTAFAGDVVRIARCGRDIDDRAHAFASIALERLTGWLVLPAISLTALAFSPELRSLGGETVTVLVIDIGTALGLVVLLAIAANRRWSTSARTAKGWRRWIGSVHLGVDALRRQPALAVATVGVGFAFQVTQCVSVWLAAKALGLDVITLLAVFAFFPPTAIGQNLPVGFGGLGVREGAFVVFFGAIGAGEERAIALGLVTYIIMVVTSSLGAPSFALGGGRKALAADVAEEEAAEAAEAAEALAEEAAAARAAATRAGVGVTAGDDIAPGPSAP